MVDTEIPGTILDAYVETFTSMSNEGTMNVTIQNVGTATADYLVTVTDCPYMILDAIPAQALTLAAGAQETLRFNIHPLYNLQSSHQCTVSLKSPTGMEFGEVVVTFDTERHDPKYSWDLQQENDCSTADLEPDNDADGLFDNSDYCPDTPNGPLLGTCVKATSGVVVGMGTTCTNDGDCVSGETCDKVQGDINGNGCGDACECYADITGPGGVPDGKVDLTDLVLMKVEFLQPCPPSPCSADLNGDNKVDLADLVIMKMQFLKTGCPC